MHSIEIPQEYWEALFLRCAELGLSPEEYMELLISGRIDATLNAEVTFYDYLKAHLDANVKIACLDPEETSVAIPMRKGEETATLLAAVNDALAQLRADGTLTALSEKYFGTDISGSDR